MKKILLLLICLLSVSMPVISAPRKVNVTIKAKNKVPDTGVNLFPYVPPIEVTYDPDTRVLEVTGDNDWLEYVFLIDEYGNWFHDSDWLPYTYTIQSDHSGIWIIRIFGVDSDDWEISAKIYVGS